MSSTKGKKQPSLDVGTLDLADLVTTSAGAPGVGSGGLDALLGGDDVPDPIGPLDYDNMTNEQATGAEISAVLAAFKDRAKREQERFILATDSEYWVGVCFQTRGQKEAFLQGVNLLQAGDKYIDGRLLAKRMGIALPEADVPYNVSAKVDGKLAAMVRDAK